MQCTWGFQAHILFKVFFSNIKIKTGLQLYSPSDPELKYLMHLKIMYSSTDASGVMLLPREHKQKDDQDHGILWQ